jgi:hypothetical protein
VRRQRRPRPAAHEPWHDVDLQIDGPAVRELKQLFEQHWISQGGAALAELIASVEALTARGDEVVRIIGSQGGQRLTPRYYATLISAIRSAATHIWVTAAYFVPTHQEYRALARAARRGVDVRLLLPSHSDSAPALAAQHSHYAELLKAGVKIYERSDGILHSKTVVVDGVWSIVGSSNFRSSQRAVQRRGRRGGHQRRDRRAAGELLSAGPGARRRHRSGQLGTTPAGAKAARAFLAAVGAAAVGQDALGRRALDRGRRREHIEAEAEVRTTLLVRHAGHLVVHIARDKHRQQRVTKLLHQLAIAGLKVERVARRKLDMAPHPRGALGRARWQRPEAFASASCSVENVRLACASLSGTAGAAGAQRDHRGVRACPDHTQQQLQLVGQAVARIGGGKAHEVKIVAVRLPAARLWAPAPVCASGRERDAAAVNSAAHTPKVWAIAARRRFNMLHLRHEHNASAPGRLTRRRTLKPRLRDAVWL